MRVQKFVIKGGIPIEGEIQLRGAKNSALPIMAASLLCSGETILENCPRLTDIFVACRILTHLGCSCTLNQHTVSIIANNLINNEIPEDLMQEMRSSIIFLGAVLGRTGACQVSYPGGCELGPRPIDLHLDALRRMGAEIIQSEGRLLCSAPKGIHGATVHLKFPSVGATENILLAAVLAKGRTVIYNAAREPEICDLASFLRSCGAKIAGEGESTIVIDGVKSLKGCNYRIMPDRIAGITYLSAAAITGGKIKLNGTNGAQIENVISLLEQAGCRIYHMDNALYIYAPKRLLSISGIKTMPHPGFPTDAQAIFMALMTCAKGVSVFEENIFENRYRHVDALLKMGANIYVSGRIAVVEGVQQLSGANINATDLRGGAAMVLAGLAACGHTEIKQISHIDRGYESIETVLSDVGADIVRKEEYN
ncbi:MAG: UDP-N-acetylglucosamine 1-carboxyvinyltransferase [Ruminococcus sp.]|nr:UDP-N-acetylglucosamine 1-carboxyvinyltransferase [Ruminococcus sp.]